MFLYLSCLSILTTNLSMGQNDAPPTIGSLDTPNSPVDPCDSHFSSMGLGGWISAWPKAAGNHQLKQRRNTGKIRNKKSGATTSGVSFFIN
jgi:hypothetical protein